MNFKNILWMAFLLSSTINLSAQINYQASVRNSNNQPIINQTVSIEVDVLQNGTTVYSESHSINTGKLGVVNLSIGNGINTSSNFNEIDWSKSNYEIQLTIDGEQLTPAPIRSVPIAEFAKKIGGNFWEWNASTNTLTLPKARVNIDENDGITDFSKHLTINRRVTINENSSTLTLSSKYDKGHVYIQYFSNGISKPRTAYVGFPTDGNRYFELVNEQPNGTIRLKADGPTETKCLKILGGCDIKEDFDSKEKLEPGDVVVIDVENPKQLKKSSFPYDKKVAGVISGANGIQSGLSLSQDGFSTGEYPLAMVGQVYVKAIGKIKIGDILTTSKTSGYAMAVKKFRKANGAIIGKALTAQNEAEGYVLVLINLQ